MGFSPGRGHRRQAGRARPQGDRPGRRRRPDVGAGRPGHRGRAGHPGAVGAVQQLLLLDHPDRRQRPTSTTPTAPSSHARTASPTTPTSCCWPSRSASTRCWSTSPHELAAGLRHALAQDEPFLLEVRTRGDLPMPRTGYWDIAEFLEGGNAGLRSHEPTTPPACRRAAGEPRSHAGAAGTLKRATTRRRPGPLDGVRVLDLSRLFAGNVLTQMLGDFGAEVDQGRAAGRRHAARVADRGRRRRTGRSTRATRRACALDLRNGEARDAAARARAVGRDVHRELPPRRAREDGPRARTCCWRATRSLVIVRISGWGQDGPYRRRPGFGTLIEGMSGFAAINGFADREPVLPPMYLADGIAGLYGASAVMIALREVEHERRQGPGDRPAAARPAVRDARSAGGELPADRQGEAAHRQPLDQRGAAQRLPLPRTAATSACRVRRRRWPSACCARSAAPTWSTTRASAPTPTA